MRVVRVVPREQSTEPAEETNTVPRPSVGPPPLPARPWRHARVEAIHPPRRASPTKKERLFGNDDDDQE